MLTLSLSPLVFALTQLVTLVGTSFPPRSELRLGFFFLWLLLLRRRLCLLLICTRSRFLGRSWGWFSDGLGDRFAIESNVQFAFTERVKGLLLHAFLNNGPKSRLLFLRQVLLVLAIGLGPRFGTCVVRGLALRLGIERDVFFGEGVVDGVVEVDLSGMDLALERLLLLRIEFFVLLVAEKTV